MPIAPHSSVSSRDCTHSRLAISNKTCSWSLGRDTDRRRKRLCAACSAACSSMQQIWLNRAYSDTAIVHDMLVLHPASSRGGAFYLVLDVWRNGDCMWNLARVVSPLALHALRRTEWVDRPIKRHGHDDSEYLGTKRSACCVWSFSVQLGS